MPIFVYKNIIRLFRMNQYYIGQSDIAATKICQRFYAIVLKIWMERELIWLQQNFSIKQVSEMLITRE